MSPVPHPSPIAALFEGVRSDEERNRRSLFLTANEPRMSATARRFMASELGDRYYSGAGDADAVVSNDFGPFMSRGLPGVAALVDAAADAAKEMLGAASVNLNPLSGVHAMTCAILATTEPGDVVMSIDVRHGGHFGTRNIIERTGRVHVPTVYDYETSSFDIERMAEQFHTAGARALYLDASYYLHPHDVRGMRAALGDAATIIYDASHTLGLVMGGTFQAPLAEGADVVCGNTHKTLPGPHKGLIAFRDRALADAANNIVDSGLYSSPHLMSIVPLAITILEMKAFGAAYAEQVVVNANELAGDLARRGFKLRRANTGRWSENHQVHVFSEPLGHHRELYGRLSRCNIAVGFDNSLGGEVYMRLGVQEITRRGMRGREMARVAELLERGLRGDANADEVDTFVRDFQTAHFSFDAPGQDVGGEFSLAAALI